MLSMTAMLRPSNDEIEFETQDNCDIAVDRQFAAINTRKPAQPVPHAYEESRGRTATIRPRLVASVPKAQIAKPAKPEVVVEEPEVIEIDNQMSEIEADNDRASVAPSEGRARNRSRGTARSAPTYECLPSSVPRDVFKDIYIPTIIKYFAKLPNAWSTSTTDSLHVIQSVWNELFPRLHISLNSTVHDAMSFV